MFYDTKKVKEVIILCFIILNIVLYQYIRERSEVPLVISCMQVLALNDIAQYIVARAYAYDHGRPFHTYIVICRQQLCGRALNAYPDKY